MALLAAWWPIALAGALTALALVIVLAWLALERVAQRLSAMLERYQAPQAWKHQAP